MRFNLQGKVVELACSHDGHENRQAHGLQHELHMGLYINYTWAICAARDASCLVRCKASHSVNVRRSSAVGWLRAAASAACNPKTVHSHALGTIIPSKLANYRLDQFFTAECMITHRSTESPEA